MAGATQHLRDTSAFLPGSSGFWIPPASDACSRINVETSALAPSSGNALKRAAESLSACSAPTTPKNAPSSIPAASALVEEHSTLIEGYSMHSLQAGAGRPLILLHGLLGAAICWRPAMLSLARQARVYAVDALGMGSSARVPDLDASLPASAQRLLSFMDRESIPQADLCASSHGGAVALFFAAMYPERVRSLILQAPANPFCSRSRPQIRLFSSRLGGWLGRRIPYAPRSLQSIALERMYGDPARVQPGSLDPYIRSLRVPGTVEYVLSVLRCWSEDMTLLKRHLRRLRGLPCLLLWGSEDRAVSLASGQLLRKALEAEFDLLPGLGHLPYEEQPQQFAERVLCFLSSLDLPQQASHSR